MYKVIASFVDLDDGKRYRKGDTFPNKSAKRLAELSSSNNKLKKPLIEKVADEKATRKRSK